MTELGKSRPSYEEDSRSYHKASASRSQLLELKAQLVNFDSASEATKVKNPNRDTFLSTELFPSNLYFPRRLLFSERVILLGVLTSLKNVPTTAVIFLELLLNEGIVLRMSVKRITPFWLVDFTTL